ncbi:hypothetical protein [Piscirickettsia litoralis]|uniref:Uncharacterized protein n=1 Tax=Piscirickettsia litoralis TaxID=1891921 RepID=A0ABX2ZYN2_9GAMM|nr:hypothetical protein [Piscirickettsia litoralis]ODN41343.1 hypothetical protein BGC07_16360 [Piscirickettsia litoralis]
MIEGFTKNKYKQRFINVAEKLKLLVGAEYVYYLLEKNDHANRVAYSTHNVWQNKYVSEFIDDCHLYSTGMDVIYNKMLTSVCFPWSYLQIIRKNHKITNDCRTDYGIHNGLSYVSNFSNFIECYSLGGHIDNEGFFQSVILNQNILYPFRVLLREIAFLEMIERKWEKEEIIKTSTLNNSYVKIIGEYQYKRIYHDIHNIT